MSPSEPHTETGRPARPRRLLGRRIGLMAAAALSVLVVGATAGAEGARLLQRWQPQPVMLLQVAPIDKMQPDSPVAVRGNVAEIFGNKFILADQNGRALIDLGPRGEDANVVARGESVTVQGRFDRGVIRAQLLVHSDGRTEALGPPPRRGRGPPAVGPLGPRDFAPPPPPVPPPPPAQ